MKRFHLLTASLAAAAALALPTAAWAGFVWSEQAPDAGDLLATAQGTFDSSFNPMDGISGFLTNTTGAYEVDLFQIRIADPAAFSATMVGDPLDFALFLFDGAGLGVLPEGSPHSEKTSSSEISASSAVISGIGCGGVVGAGASGVEDTAVHSSGSGSGALVSSDAAGGDTWGAGA